MCSTVYQGQQVRMPVVATSMQATSGSGAEPALHTFDDEKYGLMLDAEVLHEMLTFPRCNETAALFSMLVTAY